MPVVKEHDIQREIVIAVRFCGLEVYETTAYKQKGPSGVDKGIPDLLVCVPGHPIYIGVEVKRPGGAASPIKYSSPEQRAAHEKGHFVIATSLGAALACISAALRRLTQPDPYSSAQIERIARKLDTFRDSADPVREVRKVS